MSTQRMVKDSFWTDSYIANLDPTEKLLFLYLLTNPLCNIAGIYEIQSRRIAFDTGIDKDMVEKVLERFARDGKLLRVDDWVLLINHAKHQMYRNDNVTKGISRIIEVLPEKVKALKGFERLSHLTLLNLTLPNLLSEQSSASKNDMSFNNMRKYKGETGHWEEPAIDSYSNEMLNPNEKDDAEKEQRKKLRENVRTLFTGLNMPTPDPKQVNWHIGFYQTLLDRGWSHEQIASELIHTTASDVWVEKRKNGEYPGLNTVEFNLRNKDPKTYGRA